ncbi:hypothetical protein HHE02_06100 [Helicobacter heilmannii]|nr:hypothetical protein ASB1_08430 [Helicobacter heilmannii]GMB94203.1 hypothetical protein NHP21011_02940 [Helicobacter heilmannii]CRF45705.1 hypothetical protein HHE014_06760 [Helicobacter heilmannii]CRF47322.1 hypothetical protein HHE02_06100 [Helicobacter heilmannii]CRF48724.1 hypothetical protein HHE03_02980 [Helicobacter heilmannii]
MCMNLIKNVSSYFETLATHASKNYQRTREHYTRAEKNACALKYYKLGLLYFDGNCVVQDRKIAFAYFLKAAKHGEARAYCSLGLFYQYGCERPQDIARAKKCFEKGAAMGDALAQVALERMLRKSARYLIQPA